MSSQELQWGEPGPCPSCGAITDHYWFQDVRPGDEHTHAAASPPLFGRQGQLMVSVCVSQSCQSLAVWIRAVVMEKGTPEQVTYLAYPQAGVRIPPADGLEAEEIKLYEEAAAIERMSPRAARALLRALLEAFLKRHLAAAGQAVKGKNLAGLTELAVGHLDLSQTLKQGLTAIRKQGNTAVHDPYGLTEDARAEDLRWLFQAVDELVEELHVKPQKWAGMAGA